MLGIGGVARDLPDKVAVASLTAKITYGELDERQRRIAGLLYRAGIERRDRIAILAANRPEFLEVTIGALRAGVVPVPIHPLLTPREIEYVLDDSGARWLFIDRPIDAPVSIERVITFGDAYERCLYESALAEIADVALTRPMHYTSGTTGLLKGVWVSPKPPRPAARLSRQFITLWRLSRDDVHLMCSPLSHSAPHRFCLRTLEAGGTVVVQTHFAPEETLAAMDLFGATTTFMVPTHLERIHALEPSVKSRYDVSTIRLLAHAGAPIRAETKRKTIELFPYGSVWEFYGSTEGQATRISSEEWLEHPGSVGRALPGGRVIVADEDGRDLPPGEVGDVWIIDPGRERFSYWGDRAKTRAARRGDMFTVGDLGRLDEQGYLYLTARKYDTIISGGVNVYPQEVEAMLLEHPAVAEVLVYGEPHEEWGQEVRALVVPAYGQPFDPERLRAWTRQRLAGFKCPRHIDAVDELPRTSGGKLNRRT